MDKRRKLFYSNESEWYQIDVEPNTEGVQPLDRADEDIILLPSRGTYSMPYGIFTNSPTLDNYQKNSTDKDYL